MNDIQYVRQHYPGAQINRYAGDFYVVEIGDKVLGSARSDSVAWSLARQEIEKELRSA